MKIVIYHSYSGEPAYILELTERTIDFIDLYTYDYIDIALTNDPIILPNNSVTNMEKIPHIRCFKRELFDGFYILHIEGGTNPNLKHFNEVIWINKDLKEPPTKKEG